MTPSVCIYDPFRVYFFLLGWRAAQFCPLPTPRPKPYVCIQIPRTRERVDVWDIPTSAISAVREDDVLSSYAVCV